MNCQRSDPGGKLTRFTYNSYLEKRFGHKIPQYGESDPKNKANKNVPSRYNAVVGNIVNEIRQKCFCWTSYFPFNPTTVPYFAESLEVSNLHCGTRKHNTLEYVRGGVEGECFNDLMKATWAIPPSGDGVDEGGVTSEIMPHFEAFFWRFPTITPGWEKCFCFCYWFDQEL